MYHRPRRERRAEARTSRIPTDSCPEEKNKEMDVEWSEKEGGTQESVGSERFQDTRVGAVTDLT